MTVFCFILCTKLLYLGLLHGKFRSLSIGKSQLLKSLPSSWCKICLVFARAVVLCYCRIFNLSLCIYGDSILGRLERGWGRSFALSLVPPERGVLEFKFEPATLNPEPSVLTIWPCQPVLVCLIAYLFIYMCMEACVCVCVYTCLCALTYVCMCWGSLVHYVCAWE